MGALSGPGGRRRARGWLVVGFLLAVVNLPLVHGAWVSWRIDRSGVDVVASVTDTRAVGSDGGLVEFRFDPAIDPGLGLWTAGVDQEAYDRAAADDTIAVRVVPGSPSRHRVTGERGSGLVLVLTLFADAVLVGVGVLAARRRDPLLRLVALEDLTLTRPGGYVEVLADDTYLVAGEVTHVDDEGVVLDAGDRSVRVDLGAFTNPVGYQQPARVRARLPESRA